MCIVVGGLALAEVRGLVSRLLDCPHSGVSSEKPSLPGEVRGKTVSEHSKLSETGAGRPPPFRHHAASFSPPALRPGTSFLHPHLWQTGGGRPLRGGRLIMQTKTQYIPTKEHAAAVSLGNFNIHEDEHILVNGLYYAVPKFEDGQLCCSI